MACPRVRQIVVVVAVTWLARAARTSRLSKEASVTPLASLSGIAGLTFTEKHFSVGGDIAGGGKVVTSLGVGASTRHTGVDGPAGRVSIMALVTELAVLSVGVVLAIEADSRVGIAAARVAITITGDTRAEETSSWDTVVAGSTLLTAGTHVRGRALTLLDGRCPQAGVVSFLGRRLQTEVGQSNRLGRIEVGGFDGDVFE